MFLVPEHQLFELRRYRRFGHILFGVQIGFLYLAVVVVVVFADALQRFQSEQRLALVVSDQLIDAGRLLPGGAGGDLGFPVVMLVVYRGGRGPRFRLALSRTRTRVVF